MRTLNNTEWGGGGIEAIHKGLCITFGYITKMAYC